MLTFPINFLFKSAHFQLRLPSRPFRKPDPSQKCLHLLLTFSLKQLIFSSGCIFSLSGSRTRARNASMFFQISLQKCSFSAPAAVPPLPPLPFREPDPSQKCLHFLSILSLKLLMFSSGCLPSLSGSRTRARNAYISN